MISFFPKDSKGWNSVVRVYSWYTAGVSELDPKTGEEFAKECDVLALSGTFCGLKKPIVHDFFHKNQNLPRDQAKVLEIPPKSSKNQCLGKI